MLQAGQHFTSKGFSPFSFNSVAIKYDGEGSFFFRKRCHFEKIFRKKKCHTGTRFPYIFLLSDIAYKKHTWKVKAYLEGKINPLFKQNKIHGIKASATAWIRFKTVHFQTFLRHSWTLKNMQGTIVFTYLKLFLNCYKWHSNQQINPKTE